MLLLTYLPDLKLDFSPVLQLLQVCVICRTSGLPGCTVMPVFFHSSFEGPCAGSDKLSGAPPQGPVLNPATV